MAKSKEEVEALMKRLLASSRPKIIAGVFDLSKIPLDAEKLEHFRTAEYLWQLEPFPVGKDYAGYQMGVWMNESLEYVHIVMATPEFLKYVFELWRL